MFFDYVPEKPRIERERIETIGLFGPLPGGTYYQSVLGDWLVVHQHSEWRFTDWEAACDFVIAGSHLENHGDIRRPA